MNRSDLQILADTRIADAQALIDAGRWAAAYYLLRYAVECALKVCVAEEFHEHEIPTKDLVNDFYTHRLDKLLAISRLKPPFEERRVRDPQFEKSWDRLKDWTEAARYNHTITERKARLMLVAVTDASFGVLTWVKELW